MPTSSLPVVKAAKIGKQVRKALAQHSAAPATAPPSTTLLPQRISIGHNGDRRARRLRLPQPWPPQSARAAAAAGRNGKAPTHNLNVVGALSRPQANKGPSPDTWTPPRLKMAAAPTVSRRLLWQRYRVWLFILAKFVGGALSDWWRGVDTQERRALRLRQLLERYGGTLVSIGRQMAVRLVIFPVHYCEQLIMMDDHTAPLPIQTTIALIEKNSGRRFSELFMTFDPTPIATSLVSCIYQASLRDSNEKVVVKVRRPDITAIFEADFQILFQLAWLLEVATLTPPGFNATYYQELRKILVDELDFRRSAYYTELFARRARKTRKRFFTAPKIYFDLTTEELLVQAFATGMGLSEVLTAVEQADGASLAEMRDLNIDPHKVARRLLFVQHWAVYEHLTFHATPRLSNIIVGPNSTLIFLAYGASGFLDESRRDLLARLYACQIQRDAWGMVQAALALFEPLPPRDLNALAKEIQAEFYEFLLAVADKAAPWYEQTSAALWLALFRVMHRHLIVAPADLLLYVRATLFFDTVAARLYPTIDYTKAYRRYLRDVESRQRKRGVKWLRQRLQQGLITSDELVNLEKVVATGRDLLFRLQRFLTAPYDFAIITHTIEKWVATLLLVSRFLLLTIGLLGVGIAINYLGHVIVGEHVTWATMQRQVFASRWFQVAFGLLGVIHVRLILFRLADKKRMDT